MPDVLSREQLEAEAARLADCCAQDRAAKASGNYEDLCYFGEDDEPCPEKRMVTTALHYLEERDEARELLAKVEPADWMVTVDWTSHDTREQDLLKPIRDFLAKTGGQK